VRCRIYDSFYSLVWLIFNDVTVSIPLCKICTI
jgi:hypothetical protein